jgi:hypothetical protein
METSHVTQIGIEVMATQISSEATADKQNFRGNQQLQ